MKSQPVTRLLAALAVISVSIGSAQAITIASWDNFGSPGNQSETVGVSVDHVTPYDMDRGPGLTGNTGANSFNSRGWGEPAEGDFIQFGFEIDPGFGVFLSELILTTTSSNTGPGTMGVYTSLDGFNSPVAVLEQAGGAALQSSIDLSELTIGPLTGGLTIRLAEIGNTQANDDDEATSNSGTFRVSNLEGAPTRITGAITSLSVPDGGATFVLLGLGLCSLLGARRKLA